MGTNLNRFYEFLRDTDAKETMIKIDKKRLKSVKIYLSVFAKT